MQQNDEKPLVTIAIVCYNQENYITQAIQSVLDQDYRPIQIVVSDDCSTDGTRDIIKRYQKEFPDIVHAQLHDKNLGICENLISLFTPAKGRFFCWLGGDDYLLPGKISAQVAYMQKNPSLVMSYHNTNVIDETGFLHTYNDAILGQKPYEGMIAKDLIRHRCFISALSIMVDMEKIGDLRPTTVAICSDWLYFIEASMRGDIGHMPMQDVFGVYRRHNLNTTKKIDVRIEENVYKYLLDRYPHLKRDAYDGQAWSYTNYLVKYALAKNAQGLFYTTKNLMVTFTKSPSSIFFVLSCLKDRIISRIGLYQKTGTVFR